MNKDFGKLIESWIELQKSNRRDLENDENFWAYEEINSLTKTFPLYVLDFIEAACKVTNDDKILASLAAGPLEDLLVKNGNVVITEIERRFIKDAKLKKVLASVWENDIDAKVWDRVRVVVGSTPSL